MKLNGAVGILALFLVMGSPLAVHAQSLMEQGVIGSMSAGAMMGVARGMRDPAQANEGMKLLQKQGYSSIFPVPGKPTEYMAFHPTMGPVTVKMDAKNTKILSVTPK